MDVLLYFGPRAAFILGCMTAVRLAGHRLRQLGWLVQSTRNWLVWRTAIGFVIAGALGLVAWRMNNDYIVGHFDWIWPLCLGLVALNGQPTIFEVALVLSIAAIENAVMYLLLAATVKVAFYLVTRLTRMNNQSLSI